MPTGDELPRNGPRSMRNLLLLTYYEVMINQLAALVDIHLQSTYITRLSRSTDYLTKILSVSSLRNLFQSVDNRTATDFINEAHF